MIDKFELNPFELKAEIIKILVKLKGIKDFENYEIHYKLLINNQIRVLSQSFYLKKLIIQIQTKI